jgi:hypothetical protein
MISNMFPIVSGVQLHPGADLREFCNRNRPIYKSMVISGDQWGITIFPKKQEITPYTITGSITDFNKLGARHAKTGRSSIVMFTCTFYGTTYDDLIHETANAYSLVKMPRASDGDNSINIDELPIDPQNLILKHYIPNAGFAN